ncbi:MAG: hypothetical protein ABGZ17_13515 [Planctomycetaceae bacterium]
MSHSDEPLDQEFPTDPTTGKWWRRRGFVAWFLIGTALFLLTDSPIAGAMLPAIYAGSRSYNTALWLLHTDSRPVRAQICCAYFVATAFWQGAACALVNVIGFGMLSSALDQPPNAQQIGGVLMTLLGGILLTTVAGLVTSLVALATKVRVWVNPALRALINDNLDAVGNLPENPGLNYATFVLVTSVTVPVLAPWGFILTVWQGPFAVLAMGVCVPLSSILAFTFMSKRIIANHPAECWND